MDATRYETLRRAWNEATTPQRRKSSEVRIGPVTIGGDRPVAVQSMTDRNTNDTEACIEQIGRIRAAGGHIVRLTTQGLREAASMHTIAAEVRKRWTDTALVADVHFVPQVADAVADTVDKVRINPGNYNDRGGSFAALVDKCRKNSTALRIGVNHGSLSPAMVDRYGDTPEGMVESAMEFLRACRDMNFDQVVISMKSSNTRVMVHAYRMLTAAMYAEGMEYPLHLGVTEAGNGIEGRIKSAVGIGALLADGIGDTIRVSLSEAPEAEIPVARKLVDYITARAGHPAIRGEKAEGYDALNMERRPSLAVGNIGGGKVPVTIADRTDGKEPTADYTLTHDAEGHAFITASNEPSKRFPLFSTDELDRLAACSAEQKFLQLSYAELNERVWTALSQTQGLVVVLTSQHLNPVGECRAFFHALLNRDCPVPVVVRLSYNDSQLEDLQLKAAADFGALLLDGWVDGIWLNHTGEIPAHKITACMYGILQASRQRMSKTEYISCPGCGRTLFDLTQTIARVKAATSHLKTLKIGIMGCIVNGPGEMADADYGYVGAGRNRISLYKGKTCIEKNIPEEEAVEHLIALIKKEGDWTEP